MSSHHETSPSPTGTLARVLGIDGTLYLGAGWLVLTTAVVVSLPDVTSLVGAAPQPGPGAELSA